MFRPEFPRGRTALGEKAFVLTQQSTERCVAPDAPGQVPLEGSPTRLGRSFPSPVLLLSLPVRTENGWPVCSVKIPASCHPFASTRGMAENTRCQEGTS